MADETKDAGATKETSHPLAEPAPATVDMLTLQQRFRELRNQVLAAEKGDFTPLLPGWELIPEDQRHARLADALAKVTHEQFTLIHQMQHSATGPRKKAAAFGGSKAAKAPSTKSIVADILGDL